ncbi:DUF3619 family protein [Crenobacter sp. SG2303]|uniref:DUF3619 family protein n=1 Tax=Crenobacter oryzisoli TaxID=3056844 RepID=A0ABT7XLL9_9NEIS|nr:MULTISPECIES: DUF3619 family protein [unclassified Crenobacter]MDN0074688.1 DUF3619 family protein [Crenobacter sp. SG2303]MDN0084291.1 DUF3619 family protein [Crenobacter sp. SG2305]
MNHDAHDDRLPNQLTRALDAPTDALTLRQLERLKRARQAALARYDMRAEEPVRLAETAGLWLSHHARLVRRGGAALLGLLALASSLWLAESQLTVDESPTEASLLSHELPLEAFLEPTFSRAVEQ